MKYIYLLIALLIMSNMAAAQNSIRGTVYDKDTKETLPGVALLQIQPEIFRLSKYQMASF
jgi:hypothetical protein